MPVTVSTLAFALLLSGIASSQDAGTPQEERKPEAAPAEDESTPDEFPPLPAVLEFPRHQDAVLATVDGRPIRLIELGRYLQQRYDPAILDRWKLPEGRRELNSPWLAQRLWQYVDLICLRKEAELKKLPLSQLQKAVDALIEHDFRTVYVPRYEKQTGKKIDKGSVEWYRTDHRKKSGLSIEVQAVLNGLVPIERKVSELRAFHTRHGHYFGGKLLVAHIHFATRDKATGRRYSDAQLAEVRNRMREVQRALAEDPARFEDLAKRFSDDRVTGPKGGEIGWTTRFDERLPAAVVRTAWNLDQGQVSRPVESYYGYHLVKRMRFVQHHFLLPRKESFLKIAKAVQKVLQEDFLFEMRKRHRRVVRY